MVDHTDIVAAARRWIGTPYRHQASLRGVGCDCLGLVRGVWREVIGAEPVLPPPYTPDWAEAHGRETLAEAARAHLVEIAPETAGAGDVVLFRWRANLPAKHCAILSGPASLIHAHDGASVAETAFSPWWRRRLAFAFAYPVWGTLSFETGGAGRQTAAKPLRERRERAAGAQGRFETILDGLDGKRRQF